MKYRVVQRFDYKPSELALAPAYARVEDAVADMGEGLVIAPDGHVAAFHERHLPFIEAAERKKS